MHVNCSDMSFYDLMGSLDDAYKYVAQELADNGNVDALASSDKAQEVFAQSLLDSNTS